MKWLGRRASDNIEDRRKVSGAGKVGIGGGIVGIIIVAVMSYINTGEVNTGQVINEIINQTQQNNQGQTVQNEQADDELANFIAVCLADNEDVWNQIFEEKGASYQSPKTVLFRGSTTSACGNASSAIGPFYCPADQKIYIDLSFFEELHEKFGAKKGDFAAAYVLAHEVGHHVQHLLGTSDKVHELQQKSSQVKANKLSVSLELQADFYAGVWAHHIQKTKNVLEIGDIDEALSTANAIGDDMLQRRAGQEVMPDAFTHGTSEQRKKWFTKGYETGNIDEGNTFE